MNRRTFLSKTAAATVGLAALPARAYARRSPNETVNVAIIGLRGLNTGHPTWTERGRGLDHYEHLAGIKNVRITHVVDIDERHFGTSLPYAKDKWGGDPKTETDFRRVLDNRDVDAVTIAAPDHWHALMTILACQAGKDVYVEKPISHNIVEGRRMIEAARRSNRIVQVGTQARSGRLLAKAVQFVRDGGLGTIHMGKTVINRPRDPIGVAADSEVPPGVHYDLWMGPAPEQPVQRAPLSLLLALVLGLRHGRSREHRRAHAGRDALAAWQAGASPNGVLQWRHVRRRCADRSADAEHAIRHVSVRATGRNCTATCGTGSADHRRRGAFSSTAPRAG